MKGTRRRENRTIIKEGGICRLFILKKKILVNIIPNL